MPHGQTPNKKINQRNIDRMNKWNKCSRLIYLVNSEASSLGKKLVMRSTMDLDWGFPSGSVVKNPPVNAGDASLMPGSGRCPGEGNGNPLQYFCVENPMDREAWQATVHGVAKSRTQLSTHGKGSG